MTREERRKRRELYKEKLKQMLLERKAILASEEDSAKAISLAMDNGIFERYLDQFDLLHAARDGGLTIPDKHYLGGSSQDGMTPLTNDGEAWVVHELRAQRRADIQAWVGIVTPILSLLLSSVIAILGLLVALKKK